jgi:hypothetical protein
MRNRVSSPMRHLAGEAAEVEVDPEKPLRNDLIMCSRRHTSGTC